MAAKFSYEPLPKSTDCIRLLTFSCKKDGSLSGSLEQKAFASKPSYEVLSYPEMDHCSRSQKMTVNGTGFDLPEDLYHALKDISTSSTPRTIWAEDICVNETDILEKNHQRSIMYLIYSRATRVIIWLGVPQSPIVIDGDRGGFHRYGANHKASKEMAASPYWNQAWAIQAIGLAMDVNLYFGAHCFTWLEFQCRVMNSSDEMSKSTKIVLERKFNEYESADWSSSNGEQIQRPLESLLEEFKDTQCAERRDKIFAFLSLSSDWSENIITVDYSMNFYELYARVIQFQQSRTPFNIRSYEIRSEALDRPVRLMRFSQLVQNLLGGQVERDASNPEMDKGPEKFFTARGALCGDVELLGPTYLQCISSSRANASWKKEMEAHLRKTNEELLKARQSSEKYSHIFQDWPEHYPGKIRAIPSKRSFGYQENADDKIQLEDPKFANEEGVKGPRRFLGSNGILGFVPPEAQVGDSIYTFWECDVAVVLRKAGEDRWAIVGRADIAPIDQYYTRPDTIWHNALMLDVAKTGRGYTVGAGETFPYMMNLRLDLDTLQKLTN